ncbi:MAG: hypothetical protein K5765_06140 [Clostridia bacterium]|nr:hypothetical protein [Clostridia bacterium]
MEEKVIKQFETTTVPFPLYIYETKIKYNEVRKASGIAFIILDFLLKNANKDDTIEEVLLKFGIPKDLHYIFGKEIANLMGTELISSNYSPSYFTDDRYISGIRMSELTLTAKGKKLFKEGAIPTGVEKVKVKEIFFNPVTRKYDVSVNYPYTSFASSFLGEEFLDKIDIDLSGMEDYINANTTKVGLKAEERMISFETEEPQKMQVRKKDGMSIIIKPSGVEFGFETSDETSFFYKYYSSKIMTDCMLAKENYKFVDENKNIVAVPSVTLAELGNIENIYIPSDITKQAARTCKLYINRGKLGLTRNDGCMKTTIEESSKLLDGIDKNIEFALLDLSGCEYYSAFNVIIPCKRFGDEFELQLLIERKANETQFNSLCKNILEFYIAKAFNNETGKVVLFISQALKDESVLEQYIVRLLSGYSTIDGKIELLLKMNAVYSKVEEWQPIFKKYGKMLFDKSCTEIKLDNMIYKNTVLSPLRNGLKINNIDYITQFAQTTAGLEETELVYQALESAGFNTSEILGVANVVDVYMRYILDNERIEAMSTIASIFETVRVNLWKLNAMLGVEDYASYTIKEDYNVDDFFNSYSTLQTSYKKIEQYRQYANDEYKVFELYLAIYEPIHEILSIERTSSSHPDNITVKYIDDYIARGRYKEAICDLGVKMQYDLREMLKEADLQANELIDKAEKEGLIDSHNANVLHKLRMCRNGFQHPENNQIKFDKPTIENWRDIVFSIKRGNK